MSQERYGVLLVTGGHTHQENYGLAFAADRRCRLIALSDEPTVTPRRRQLNEALARRLQVPHIANLAEALARQDVQLVCLCAEPERRGRIAVQCAEAGKHLYLDKSLAPTLAQADALVAAVQRANVRSHMFSFLPQAWAQQAKRLVQSDTLGRLLAIHADVFFAKGRNGTATLGTRRQEEYPPQRHQLIEAKREMDNCGVYPLTLIRWLTGRRFRTVYCQTANYFFREHQQHNVEDFGLMTCTLDEGLPVTVASGRTGWTAHPGFGSNRVILVGSERTLVVDAARPRLEIYTDEAPWTPPNAHRDDPMGFWASTMEEVHLRPKRTWSAIEAARSDVAYFLDRLQANRDSELNVAEAALTTEVLLAGYRSAATGEVVTLPLPR